MSLTIERNDSFGVVGMGLHRLSEARLKVAFPGCLLLEGWPADQAETHRHFKAGEHVTVFVDLPASGGVPHQNASLLFNQSAVKVVAVCTECTYALCDDALLLEFSGAIEVASHADVYRRAAAAVQRGELWFSRNYLSRLTRKHLNGTAKLDLSEREAAILRLMAEDSNNQEIADRLFITRDTVRWHLKSLYAKLGVSDRGSPRRFARNMLPECRA